jgi:hypothetical protein
MLLPNSNSNQQNKSRARNSAGINTVISGSGVEGESSSLPKIGQALVCLFLSDAEQTYVLGDLNEEFLELGQVFGDRRARVWFYGQVLRSLGPLIHRLLYRALHPFTAFRQRGARPRI